MATYAMSLLMPNYARKKDANHEAIADRAKVYGWEVVDLSGAGRGCFDMLCWHAGHGFRLIEAKRSKGGKLTPAQIAFRQRYRMPVTTVCSEEEADLVFSPNACR